MRLILAIFLPWLQFFTIGRPIAGIICLILQCTLIGWIPAAMWSVYALSQYKTDQKNPQRIRRPLRPSEPSGKIIMLKKVLIANGAKSPCASCVPAVKWASPPSPSIPKPTKTACTSNSPTNPCASALPHPHKATSTFPPSLLLPKSPKPTASTGLRLPRRKCQFCRTSRTIRLCLHRP